MSGLVSPIGDTVQNTNQAVRNTGNAMRVAQDEMPRFNDNFETAVGSFDKQADAINQTAAQGVNQMNYQADAFNQTAAQGVNQMNYQADAFNQTAAQGVNQMNYQAEVLNQTTQDGVASLEDAVRSINSTSEVVNGALKMWEPNLDLFVSLLGPLQCATGAFYLTSILKMVGVLPDVQARAFKKLQQELQVTNTILQDMVEGHREVVTPDIVQKITKSSMLYDKTNGKIKSYFFFSDNNMVVEQLRGMGYFAHSTISELFEQVFIWNAFADAAVTVAKKDSSRNFNSPLHKFENRHTLIYFLDPHPKSKTLSHVDFTGVHRNLTIKNHYQAKKDLTLNSVKVYGGCSVRFEHITVLKIDSTLGGKAHLNSCNVGWVWPAPSPLFLFCGKPEEFDNPLNICGSVSCNEILSIVPLKDNNKWPNIFNSRSAKQLKGSKERTITNNSDRNWFVTFKPNVELMSNSGFEDSISSDHNSMRLMIPPLGGKITFAFPEKKTGSFYSMSDKTTNWQVSFIDDYGDEYPYNCKGQSNLPDFTLVGPAIDSGRQVVDNDVTYHLVEEMNQIMDDKPLKGSIAKMNTILVVGRFGSGKSTLLNTLAGVYWKFSGGEFIRGEKAPTEMFKTSRSAKGCTVSAVAQDITTFDGRELTVIDTVGYDDTVNAESFYNTSNLSEVMDQFSEISAVVIVVNSKDERLTQGFIESLACVPASFKKEVQKNIVLVFTKWTEDDEEDHGDEPYRGFTEQVKIIRAALGFRCDSEDDAIDPIPAFWVDNRQFKKYSANARLTIERLTSFVDHVAEMPQLSCKEFKEMRCLSQFERSTRKVFKLYFQPSGSNLTSPSGFETFLLTQARQHKEGIKKMDWNGYTAKVWADKLVNLLQHDITHQLPREVKKMCEEVAIRVDPTLMGISNKESVGAYASQFLIFGGSSAAVSTAPITLGLTLLALPGCAAIAYAYSKTWSREDVINRVVFGISEKSGRDLCAIITDQISSHVDKRAEEIQLWFASNSGGRKEQRE